MLVSTVIPSSLSYSSCCSSSATSTTATTSTNVKTVSVPIQVIKTQKKKSNHNSNNSISTSTSASTINTLTDSHKGYRYIPKQSEQLRPLLNLKAGNQIQPLHFLSVSAEQRERDKESCSFFFPFFSALIFYCIH